MSAWNRESRKLMLRYELKSAQLNLGFARRQTQLSLCIDLAKNELHYLNQQMRHADAGELAGLKGRMDAVVEQIGKLSREKVELDFDRKNCLVSLARERAAEADALEAKYNREEVVAV